jgi:small subunit ribosomal protein S18
MVKKIKLKVSARLLKKKSRKNSSSAPKRCRFKGNPDLIKDIDYKNVDFLKNFLTERGKILPARISGNSTKYQRVLAKEIKKARIMALLPYNASTF